jgi:hypothetical protein
MQKTYLKMLEEPIPVTLQVQVHTMNHLPHLEELVIQPSFPETEHRDRLREAFSKTILTNSHKALMTL